MMSFAKKILLIILLSAFFFVIVSCSEVEKNKNITIKDLMLDPYNMSPLCAILNIESNVSFNVQYRT